MSYKSARVKSGKKVTEVMEYMGVTDAAVYLWETGKSQPKADKLLRLAKFYGCTVEDLLAPDTAEGSA